MTMSKKRWAIALLTTIAIAAFGYRTVVPAPIDVDASILIRGPLKEWVEDQGQTRARLRYTVATPMSGRLLRTHLTEGDWVEANDVIALIVPIPADRREEAIANAELAAAEATRRQAVAQLEAAEAEFEKATGAAKRRAELFTKGLISGESSEVSTQTETAMRASVEAARAAVAMESARLERANANLIGLSAPNFEEGISEIRAPVSGRVLRVHEESERSVLFGAPVVDLGGDDSLEIVVDVLTQEAVRVNAGDRIEITGWGGDQVLEGRVRLVEPGAFTKVSTLGVEEQRVNIIGDLIDENPGLGANYRIEAAVVTWESDDVLLIPSNALFRRDGEWHTFAVVDGRAALRKLSIGHRNAHHAEVLDGAAEGEPVIQFPSELISEGVRVSFEA